jgi:hypothetical protein
MPSRDGSSHASALTATTILWGKPGGPPGSGLVVQAKHPFFKKPFTPFAHNLPGNIKFGGNYVVI